MTVPHDPALVEDSAEELYEDAPCGYLSCYPDGRIARVNRTFLAWTGYDRGALVGAKRFVDLLSGGGRIYHETHYLPLLRMQGEVRAIAVDLVAADGSTMPVLVNSRLHRDAQGREVAIRTTVFDARDRKAYETELLAARRRADRLAGEQRQVAVTLQTSMLPATLPSDPRLQLSAYYRPGVEGLEVGGDWYDAFPLDGDRVAVVVGDVVGRGLAAAAAMGQLRSAVRALATTDAGPAALLEHLDRFVDGFPAAQTATLAYAELDLRDGRVRYACAGHPPPVVIDPDGRPTLLWGGRSAPLGAQILTTTRDEATVDLAPGSRLALYTDGLVERRDQPLDDRIEGLADALATLARRPMARYAEDVTEQALADVDVVDDDVCLLTLAYRQHPTFARELPAEPRRLTDLRRDLDTWLHAEGVVGADHEAVVLACSEAVNNAVEYAYPAERLGVVEVLAGVTPDEVQVRVRDWGEWRTARPPEDRGRGLAMIRSVMDEVSVDRSAGTVLSMRRMLRGGGGSPES